MSLGAPKPMYQLCYLVECQVNKNRITTDMDQRKPRLHAASQALGPKPSSARTNTDGPAWGPLD
jgi:hypothetical protein